MKDVIQTVKIINHAGVSSIKDGMKSNAYSEIIREKKPKWIRISANQNNKSFELIIPKIKNTKETINDQYRTSFPFKIGYMPTIKKTKKNTIPKLLFEPILISLFMFKKPIFNYCK